MLFPTKYNFYYTNLAAVPNSTLGTQVVPGYNNTKGSWTQVASAANIAQTCYLINLIIVNAGGNGITPQLTFDIGIDTAGGTSYTAIISNATAGGAGSVSNRGKDYVFPITVPAGSSVAIRAASPTTGSLNEHRARYIIEFWGQPTTMNSPIGTFSETIGYTSGTTGTSFTLGNATYGSWTSLGTTTNPLWWWQLGVNYDNNTVVTGGTLFIQLAHGDVTTKNIINTHISSIGTGESHSDFFSSNTWQAYSPLPAGTELWVRGLQSATPDTGYNATVIGIG